jgi:hypothetical protein
MIPIGPEKNMEDIDETGLTPAQVEHLLEFTSQMEFAYMEHSIQRGPLCRRYKGPVTYQYRTTDGVLHKRVVMPDGGFQHFIWGTAQIGDEEAPLERWMNAEGLGE